MMMSKRKAFKVIRLWKFLTVKPTFSSCSRNNWMVKYFLYVFCRSAKMDFCYCSIILATMSWILWKVDKIKVSTMDVQIDNGRPGFKVGLNEFDVVSHSTKFRNYSHQKRFLRQISKSMSDISYGKWGSPVDWCARIDHNFCNNYIVLFCLDAFGPHALVSII